METSAGQWPLEPHLWKMEQLRDEGDHGADRMGEQAVRVGRGPRKRGPRFIHLFAFSPLRNSAIMSRPAAMRSDISINERRIRMKPLIFSTEFGG